MEYLQLSWLITITLSPTPQHYLCDQIGIWVKFSGLRFQLRSR
jgi:hypothetical protein